MSRLLAYAAAVIVLVAAVAAGLQAWDSQREWESRAVHALASADTLRARADSLEVVAGAAQVRADSLAKLADERGRQVMGRVVAIRERETPDSCAPFVVPRDEIIDTLVVVAGDWKSAFTAQLHTSVALRAANFDLTETVDSLYDVLSDRPRPGSWWKPLVGLGAFSGVCTAGPCLGAGVTLSWRLP